MYIDNVHIKSYYECVIKEKRYSIMKAKINNNQIKHDTGKAVLVTVPGTSSKCWIPSKFVYSKGYYSIVYLPDDMEFSCVRGKTIKFTMTGEELAEAFGGNDQYRNASPKPKVVEVVHTPEPKEPVEVDADEELIR